MESIDINHNENEQRFEKGAAFVVYHLKGQHMIIEHTEVPVTMRNQRIAGALIRAALREAARQNWTVEPQCSYAANFIERHREFHPLLKHAPKNPSR